MRIMLALPTLQQGGTEQQVARLARELHAKGHIVTVCCLHAGGPLHASLERDGITAVQLSSLWRWPWLVRQLRRMRPDVVHAFLLRTACVVLPAAAIAGVPLRICGWRSLAPTRGRRARLRRSLYRMVARCAHQHTVNAVAVGESLPPAIRARAPATIYNGVDLPHIPARPLSARPRGIVVANLIAYKGHQDLCAALAMMPDPPVIDCYGEGPQRAALERAIERHSLQGVMNLHGTDADAARHYRHADFAVLPSHEEGLPNALLEAMAAGLPCIATAVGGIPELITDGFNGLLVPARDPVSLAAAIDRLVKDAGLRRDLGAAARHQAAHFSWATCRDRHLELYGVH